MRKMNKMVESPAHYNQGNIEAIDAMISAYGADEVMVFCKINAFKYLWRLGHKDAEEQEIGKIKWYLDKYLELKDGSESYWVSKLEASAKKLKEITKSIRNED